MKIAPSPDRNVLTRLRPNLENHQKQVQLLNLSPTRKLTTICVKSGKTLKICWKSVQICVSSSAQSEFDHVDVPNNQRSSIETHAQRLRERTDAICRFSSGVPTLEEGIKVFRDYCQEYGMWIDAPVDLSTQPDAYGDEHEVWFNSETIIKLTYPDFFGLRVVYRTDEDKRCNPCEYFERWVLHNDLFGDDVEVLGAFETTKGMRTVLSQKAIQGNPATEEEIRFFFKGNGWLPFRTDDGCAWFDQTRLLVISDTHQGNLIKTPDDFMVPIDFRIQPVSGSILDGVRSMV